MSNVAENIRDLVDAVDETWTVSIDAGGTFTDAIARSSQGSIRLAKVASTPADPSLALGNAIASLSNQGIRTGAITLICHGTTVATNATLTGAMANVALVTTSGFRDVLGYRQSNRPDIYSLTPERPTELVPRNFRFEIVERIGSSGEVVTPLDRTSLTDVIEKIRASRPEAVAVSLLFSYLNDTHEQLVAEAIRKAFPELPVTVSSEIVREFREYPRTATTAINAALRPIVEEYLSRAESRMIEQGTVSPFVVMQSNGGTVPAGRAGQHAHRLVLSGPAGGVSGLMDLANDHGLTQLISLDMGGTSTDVCLVRDGLTPFTTLQQIQDHTLLAPSVDIHTIGAGGGSIAWLDSTKRLRVGPLSAKAVPGPASYGRGGEKPTLTDAHVVLGTLGTGDLAGGLRLDKAAAVRAVNTLSTELGQSAEETAEAILAISLAHMVRAVRKVSVERGLDPREFTLVPFGGAGPIHAGFLLRQMGLREVIIPLRPGLFSADGLLAAGLRIDESQTVLSALTDENIAVIQNWLLETSSNSIQRMRADGVDGQNIELAASVDCRYQGQGFELNVPIDDWREPDISKIEEKFHEAHRMLYGHRNDGELIEIVTVRLATIGRITRAGEEVIPVPRRPLNPSAVADRREVFLPGTGRIEIPIIERDRLEPGAAFSGPAIIQQMDSTSVILPGQQIRVASNKDLVITEEK